MLWKLVLGKNLKKNCDPLAIIIPVEGLSCRNGRIKRKLKVAVKGSVCITLILPDCTIILYLSVQ